MSSQFLPLAVFPLNLHSHSEFLVPAVAAIEKFASLVLDVGNVTHEITLAASCGILADDGKGFADFHLIWFVKVSVQTDGIDALRLVVKIAADELTDAWSVVNPLETVALVVLRIDDINIRVFLGKCGQFLGVGFQFHLI